MNYGELCQVVGGKKLFFLVQLCQLVQLSGAVICYQIVIQSLSQFVAINNFNADAKFINSITFRTMISVPLCVCIIFPLSLLKKMSSFNYFSTVTLFVLFYIFVVLAVELPSYFKEFYKPGKMVYAHWDLNIFLSYTMAAFSYNMQPQVLPVCKELANPTPKRMNKAVVRSVLVNFMFYSLISICGYFSQFDQTAVVVLERPSLKGRIDYPIFAGVLAIVLMLCVGTPLKFLPIKQIITYMRRGSDETTNKENIVMASITYGLTTAITILFPRISVVISILGGSSVVTMVYAIPCYLFVKTSQQGFKSKKNVAITIFVGILVIAGFCSVFLNCVLICTGKKNFRDYWTK